ncbi:hypothetical protein [Dehalogenimonas alkenigignens]|uniref:hypothetical protein n=1 Tax=Dehalogenimonas alkenigignens TaxID=1217799 RepID=UPI001187651C|nr:hypothetical protein [Dehalogenimonas alkenigignens]
MLRKWMVVICISLPMTIGGCGEDAQLLPPPYETFCPDAGIDVDLLVINKAPYETGHIPLSDQAFPSGQIPIYCTFWLTGDLCCTKVTVECVNQGTTVYRWVEDGNNIRTPQTVVMMPANGWLPGTFELVLFIDLRRVVESTFTVIE